jgi:hypothetical protein
MKRGCLTPLALFIAIAGLFAWAESAMTIRYRLTLFVDDNGQTVTGSSVYETVWGGVASSVCRYTPICGNRSFHPTVRGEALAVDLGARGVLFSLLTDDSARISATLASNSAHSPAGLLVETFGNYSIGSVTWRLLYQIRGTRGPVDVPLQKLLLLVRFGDLNDPKTVERVDPADLAASFGPGVKLVRATIEITKDPVTTGIEKRLPWLALPDDAQWKFLQGLEWPAHNPADNIHDRRLLPNSFKAEGELL